MTFRPYSDGNFNVAIQIGKGIIGHVKVPKPVYDYILQLENAVRDETGYIKSKLKEIYPSRF